MIWLKQSTAINVRLGPFLDSTDGNTAEDGLTVTEGDIWISKNHAAPAHPGASVTLVADTQGLYAMSLGAADTNTRGPLQLWIHESGALMVWHEYMVLPANTYESLVDASDKLDINTVEIAAGIISAGVFAADAITSGTLAASAGTEIATAVWISTTRALTAAAMSAAIFDTSAMSAGHFAAGFITSGAFAANVSPQEVVTAYDAPTKAELDAGLAALNDIAAADVWAVTIDATMDAQESLQWVLAYASGNIAVDSTAFAYKAFDQSTTLFTNTVSTTMRTRS